MRHGGNAHRPQPGVSALDRNLDLQRAALDYAQTGDTFVVWKLDRLGRSIEPLLELEQRDINLRSITGNIGTTTAAGRFFFQVVAALVNMERDLIVERMRPGLKRPA